MQVDESVTQYVECIGSLDKRLATAGKNFGSDDKIRTLLRRLSSKYASSRYLIRELGEKNHQAVAMTVEKEAELNNTVPRMTTPKQAMKNIYCRCYFTKKRHATTVLSPVI